MTTPPKRFLQLDTERDLSLVIGAFRRVMLAADVERAVRNVNCKLARARTIDIEAHSGSDAKFVSFVGCAFARSLRGAA